MRLDFPGGATARISLLRTEGDAEAIGQGTPRPGFRIEAERGSAWVEPPDLIEWTDAEGAHEERLPATPSLGEVLNDHFYRLVRGGQSLAPTLRDALAVDRLIRDLPARPARTG